MAQAVKRLYPSAKLAIGPAIANGFYYDFDFETPLTTEDFAKIEKEMAKIVTENYPVERFELPRAEALELMKEEPYKPSGRIYRPVRRPSYCIYRRD